MWWLTTTCQEGPSTTDYQRYSGRCRGATHCITAWLWSQPATSWHPREHVISAMMSFPRTVSRAPPFVASPHIPHVAWVMTWQGYKNKQIYGDGWVMSPVDFLRAATRTATTKHYTNYLVRIWKGTVLKRSLSKNLACVAAVRDIPLTILSHPAATTKNLQRTSNIP